MFKYYLDIEINISKIGADKKNSMIEYLFNTIHGTLRSKDYDIGLSFPKFSASKDDKFPTLGRIFRLVSNSVDDLNDFIGRNGLDNLIASEVILNKGIQKIPEDFVSYYVFKRHHPNYKRDENGNEMKTYIKGSLDNCVCLRVKSGNSSHNFYIKRVKVEKNTNEKFSTYGLGSKDGPEVPVF